MKSPRFSFKRLSFVLLFASLAAGGPPMQLTIGSYDDPSCNQIASPKQGLSNPQLFASTCLFFKNGPPLIAGDVTITFQSCSATQAKLNTWPSSGANSCIGLPNTVTYDMGGCKAYVEANVTRYYKISCSPASALPSSLSAALVIILMFFLC